MTFAHRIYVPRVYHSSPPFTAFYSITVSRPKFSSCNRVLRPRGDHRRGFKHEVGKLSRKWRGCSHLRIFRPAYLQRDLSKNSFPCIDVIPSIQFCQMYPCYFRESIAVFLCEFKNLLRSIGAMEFPVFEREIFLTLKFK